MAEEIWKNVEFNPAYEVSNLGRVRSYLKKGNHKEKTQSDFIILSPGVEGSGYMFVNLSPGSGGSRRNFKVHRLVAKAFFPEMEDSDEVNHIDENKLNNCLSNLELCSRKYNQTYSFGKQVSFRSEDGVIYSFESLREASRVLGIQHSGLSRLSKGLYKQYKGFTNV